MNTLEVYIAGMRLSNPLMSASGCFGYGTEYADIFDPNLLGAVVLKGVTPEAREGNAGVRIAETASGMLNCVGLENVGLENFIRVIVPEVRKSVRIPLVANINGKTVEEYTLVAERLSDNADIAALELNISCPNVKEGGMAFGTDPVQTARVVSAVRKASVKPLIVKLSPNVTDICAFAKIAETEGADALSLINTVSGMAIDIEKQRPLLGNVFGGLSGPAVKPVALRMIYQTAQVTSLPIIGMGGIQNARDAIEFILAGASAVAVGCALFKNPLVFTEIKKGLEDYCAAHICRIEDLVGAAHPDGGEAYKTRLKKRRNIWKIQR